jgi:predicted hydrocarbon binding protein
MQRSLLKGQSLISTIDFLDRKGTLKQVLSRLDRSHRALFDRKMLPSTLYPVDSYTALLEGVCDVYREDAMRVCYEIGRRVVNDGLKNVYRVFLKSNSPLWVLRRSPGLWRSYHRGSEIEIVEAEKGRGKIAVIEKLKTTEGYCETRRGGIAEALELAGAKGLDVSHPSCRARGDGVCVFEVRWRSPE